MRKANPSKRLTALVAGRLLVTDVSVGRHALLNIENQPLRSQHPITLPVLGYDLLRQPQRAVLRFFRFLLIDLGLVDLNQRRPAPCGAE